MRKKSQNWLLHVTSYFCPELCPLLFVVLCGLGVKNRAGSASQSVSIKLQHQLSLLSTCSPVGSYFCVCKSSSCAKTTEHASVTSLPTSSGIKKGLNVRVRVSASNCTISSLFSSAGYQEALERWRFGQQHSLLLC